MTKQSEAAKKAWITRRKNEIRSGLSKTTPKVAEESAESKKASAAKKAWRTRRINEIKAEMKAHKKTKVKSAESLVKKKISPTYCSKSSMAARKAWITRRRNAS